ncbi:MAG TPA: phospholipase D family protein [Steroidobacteraceae bacterium]|jgi:phosphatidylserine/phosphatidylglycerophosphate/cardiolipin synthase-like enzyme|nr:phospholipase D family protein [Steroidobacteraceae bacterium]
MRNSWIGVSAGILKLVAELRRGTGVACGILLLAGCVGLPQHVQKFSSEALRQPETTALGRTVEAAKGGPNLSGIRLLTSGDEALASLIALADRAERTLDIQYYLIHQDDSARLLLHHVRLAADRGVRVRVLVDDLNTAGEDRRFMHLGQHANVEVRVFNPFAGGRSAMWTRIVASVSEIPRINHRMHNKLFVADNALAITGGRNIGDQYFTRDPHSNFIDLDVVAAGAIVPKLSASFDAFWNSKYAYPIASVAAPVQAEAVPQALEESAVGGESSWLAHELDADDLQLTWVPATVLADRPGKIASEAVPNEEVTIANDIKTLMRSAQWEVIVISPYFVPGSDGVSLMRELVERGVHIRILTNSLASTDSPLVHNGYARYRVALLKLGVELSEVRPILGQKRPRFHPFRGSNASLHAKALVIDQKTVFIGSMNMDARSARTNSELGLVMRSPEIARQVTSLLDDISADGSYKLQLDPHDRIVWSSGEPDAERMWHTDPETTHSQRVLLRLLAPFAPEELL